MSTFTDSNGPSERSFTGSNGPSTPGCGQPGSIKSYTELIEAYNNLSTIVHQHIAALASVDNPHTLNPYLDELLARKQDKLSIQAVISPSSTDPVQSAAIATALASKQDVLTFDNMPKASSSNPVTSNGVLTAINTAINTIRNLLSESYQEKLVITDLPSAGSTAVVTSGGIYTAINNLAIALNAFKDNFIITPDVVGANKVLASTKYILGRIHAEGIIDFTDWVTFAVQPAGLDTSDTTTTSGAYILGQISTNWGVTEPGGLPGEGYNQKAARAYIKCIGDHSIDAIVDMVVSYDVEKGYVGSLSVQSAHEKNEWKDLGFHLMEGVSGDGTKKIVYLCISSSSFAYNDYPLFNFRACGVNFIPPTAEGYTQPNGSSEYKGRPIASVSCGAAASGYAVDTAIVNELYITKLLTNGGRDLFEIQDVDDKECIVFAETPYVKDEGGTPLPIVSEVTLNTIIPIGAIIRWPNMNKVPARFKACDGSTVDATQYAALAEIIEPVSNVITLPVEDNSIIRLY